ncbi:IS66 family transposase zinc-finger binding domain-containing protein, partial [Clostridium vincentii]|uniref:IS66 family transposase n=1 Tax=Clostridium vincentii TaxID=52704 RepID=UPI001A9A4F95
MNNEVKKSENQTEYINTLESQVKMLENKIAWMMEQITLSKHKKFGASSEKSQYDQFSLFDEVETEADVSVKEPELEEINYKRKKCVGKKAEMLEDLDVEVVEYYLPEHERSCPECSNALHIMGKNIRKELKIIPAQARVV